MRIPRNDYPRPQMMRESWLSLNGTWEFEFDFGKSGKERGVVNRARFEREITVPFCPESKLSGIEYTDFINACWYRRTFQVPREWQKGRTLLHFEAVDYFCEVWVNGSFIGSHIGGYTPFFFDISAVLKEGENIVTVYVEDDTRTGAQPCGKQSQAYASWSCLYTRVTGIWQTAWLENVPQTYIRSYRVEPDIDNSVVYITVNIKEPLDTKTIDAVASFGGKEVGRTTAVASGKSVKLAIPLSQLFLWQPGEGNLYDLELALDSGDHISGYFGMRKVELAEKTMLINGKPVFQRLVLDQGFYPDGIYTAPSDDALKRDIELALALGFNGARLHQKVFERRFLYHADHAGYMVWGEYANWGLSHSKAEALGIFLPQWLEVVERDFNSPALIGWCPFNETWDQGGHRQDDAVLRGVYHATKAADQTRPVIDTSGNFHVVTDIYDVHDYEQNVKIFAARYAPMKDGGAVYEPFPERQKHSGQPYFLSEYGGIEWNPTDEESWGYGSAPKTVEEYTARFAGLTRVLLSNPNIFAFCYTQLYDVEQEKNGLYFYDRTLKFTPETMERLRAAMAEKAAIEEL